MNAKTEQQIANLKTQTIGVEIEMNHITRKNAAKLAADFFGTGRYEDTAHRNGYYTWSAWDAEGREWKFQRDVSIAGADSEKCELVTPILHYEDIEILQELVRRLRKAGAISHAGVGAGVHIHIGANGHTPQTLRNLANIMASHESLLAEALKLDTNRMRHYCRTIDPNFLPKARLSFDCSNSTDRKTAKRTACTQDSLRATFSFAWHFQNSQRSCERQAQNPSSTRIRNSPCEHG